jgi:hypothetical protein
MLLSRFAENPLTSAYDISRGRHDYDSTKKRIKRLKVLKLIEEVTGPQNIHNEKPLKLSAHGVYNLVTNNASLKPNTQKSLLKILSAHGVYDPVDIVANNARLHQNTQKSLLKNYGDHSLFKYFLYRCIKRDTMLEIGDSGIFYHVFSYLHDCCKKVEEMMYMISHTYNQQNGNLIQYLFSWDNISDDKDRLRFFLKEKFNWNWLDNAEVNKTEDGNSIKISHGSNSALITLNKDKTNADLRYRGEKRLEFDVKGFHIWTSELPALAIANIKSSTNGYGNFKSNLVNTAIRNYVNQHRSVEKTYMESFMIYLHMRVQQLIFSILSNYGPELGYKSAAIRILSHDSKFMQTLKETKNQFKKRYNFFMEKQKSF